MKVQTAVLFILSGALLLAPASGLAQETQRQQMKSQFCDQMSILANSIAQLRDRGFSKERLLQAYQERAAGAQLGFIEATVEVVYDASHSTPEEVRTLMGAACTMAP